MTESAIWKAAVELAEMHQGSGWFVGTGLGRNGGQDVIWLFVRRTNNSPQKKLKRDGFKGFRVIVQRTGFHTGAVVGRIPF